MVYAWSKHVIISLYGTVIINESVCLTLDLMNSKRIDSRTNNNNNNNTNNNNKNRNKTITTNNPTDT